MTRSKKSAGLEPRQHAHLRAALDLEDADRIGVAEHVVDIILVRRHAGEGVAPAVVLIEQIEGTADAAQHAEAEHIDLEDAERIEIVLVPFDDGAVLHRRILDRDELIEPPPGDDEAADMLREVAREAQQLPRQFERQA